MLDAERIPTLEGLLTPPRTIRPKAGRKRFQHGRPLSPSFASTASPLSPLASSPASPLDSPASPSPSPLDSPSPPPSLCASPDEISDVESTLVDSVASQSDPDSVASLSDPDYTPFKGSEGFERVLASFPAAMVAMAAHQAKESARGSAVTQIHEPSRPERAAMRSSFRDCADESSQPSDTYDTEHITRLVRPRPRASLEAPQAARTAVDAALAALFYPLVALVAWFVGLGYVDGVAPYLEHANVGVRALALAPGWGMLALVAAWGLVHGLEAARKQPLLLALGVGVAWAVWEGGKSPLPRFDARPALRPAPKAWGWATVGDWAAWTGEWAHF
jgi:hypothetical protein